MHRLILWSCDGESNSGLRVTNTPLCQLSYHSVLLLVAPRRIELHLPAFQTGARTSYAREPLTFLERMMGLEPMASTLARSYSRR